jgi:polysaccharide export outer membrane protein
MSYKLAAGYFCLVAITAFGQKRLGDSASTAGEGPGAITSGLVKASANLVIGPGDLIDVAVFDIPELSTSGRVTNSGDLPYPLLGSVKVMGKTAAEVEKAIADGLRDNQFVLAPHVTVLVREYATQGVSVMGEVHRPGTYPLVGTHTLMDVISAVGGLTSLAGNVISLTPSGSSEPSFITIDRRPGESWKNNPEIHPGDRIEVGRGEVVYVVGEVGRPGGYVTENGEPITVMKALALADGNGRSASFSHARVLRKTPQGLEQIPVPVKAILAGKAEDIVLKENDMLVIPGSASNNLAKRTLEQMMYAATSLAVYSVRY